MKKCPNCNQEINDEVICPNCGILLPNGSLENKNEEDIEENKDIINEVKSDLDQTNEEIDETNDQLPSSTSNPNNTSDSFMNSDNSSNNSSNQSIPSKKNWIDILKVIGLSILTAFKDLFSIILHPDAERKLSINSMVVIILLELLSTFSLMATVGETIYFMIQPIYQMFSMGHFWQNSLSMNWLIPFITAVILVMIEGLIFTITLLIGRRGVSFTKVVSHLVVPSLSLLFASLSLRLLSVTHWIFLYVTLAFIFLWLMSLLMHVVDDLKISNYYLRIVILTLVAATLIMVIILCFQYLMTSMLTLPSNQSYPQHFGNYI